MKRKKEAPKQVSQRKKVKNPQSFFSQNVLGVVRGIPLGQTLSYREVATKAGSPRASRAVGSLMARNADLTVPCHRVVRSDGKIGNYNRGGEKAKRALLKKEGAL